MSSRTLIGFTWCSASQEIPSLPFSVPTDPFPYSQYLAIGNNSEEIKLHLHSDISLN